MPEGDNIHIIAGQLRTIANGRPIVAAQAPEAGLRAETITGTRIVDVEARGKHLLIHLDDGTTLHSHLGMTGSWHRYRPGERWQKPAHRAALRLEIPGSVIVCFTPEILERLESRRLPVFDSLTRLGPDILDPAFDGAAVVARMQAVGSETLGVLVLDQTMLCGVGNIYKSEGLFVARLDPFSLPGDHPSTRLEEWIAGTRKLMQRNLEGRPRRTRGSPHGPRMWVYRRADEPCLVCGTTLRMQRQGNAGRSTYWCGSCQPAVRGG